MQLAHAQQDSFQHAPIQAYNAGITNANMSPEKNALFGQTPNSFFSDGSNTLLRNLRQDYM